MAAVPIPITPHPTPLGEDPVVWLRLIRSRRVGAVTFHRLMAEHGGISAALAALPELAAAAGIGNYAVCPAEVALAELARGRKAGARLLLYGDAHYPAALRDLADAPPVLWARGDVTLLNRPAVALVGARNASSLGLRMARRLAESLGAAGQVVVSGLARGIDAEAHRAALSTGTVAVMAGGVDVIYPEENADLALRIAAQGCLVSEQPPGTEPQARHFPLRNRIVSGLARAIVVVEAAAKSGSLITAKAALDQGREVLAVPGHPFDARAAGGNQLIRDGAILVRGTSDVLEALPHRAPERVSPERLSPEGPRAPVPAVPPEPIRCRIAPGAAGPAGRMPPEGANRAGPASGPACASALAARAAGADAARQEQGRGRQERRGEERAVEGSGGDDRGKEDRDYQEWRGADPDAEDRRGEDRGNERGGGADRDGKDLPARILDLLGASPLPEDQLIRDLSLSPAWVNPVIAVMELDGLIERAPGGLLSRTV